MNKKSSYVNAVANPETPAIERAKDTQVVNSTGGYTFKVDDWTRLERFLIVGNEKGSYYATARKLTVQNFSCVKRLLKANGKRVVDTIVEISDSGRAPKNASAVFALAVCSVYGDESTKAYSNKSMPKVARFSTDLYAFVNAVNELKNGKKSTSLKRAIGRWYNEKEAVRVAYQICKYPQRVVDGNRWSHADLLRIARPGPNRKTNSGKPDPALSIASPEHNLAFRYAVHGVDKEKGISADTLEMMKGNDQLKYIYAHEQAKKATKSSEIVKLIDKYNLTRESIPNNLFGADVWKALIPKMPLGALIRNLGQMTSKDVLKPLADATELVVEKLTNEKALQKARIHPMNVFSALKVYNKGQGFRSTWTPVAQISDALEKAFYKSFKYVEPTGKKILLGIDVSGSMEGGWYGWGNSDRKDNDVTPREAAAVVAMTIARTEKNSHMMAFSNRFMPLDIKATDSLQTVVNKMSRLRFSSTDCSLPMKYAIDHKLDVDAFVILTDNETNTGVSQAHEKLNKYRKDFGRFARMVVLAFTATEFTIADPDDGGMMDIAGLDSAVPQILSNFISGKI